MKNDRTELGVDGGVGGVWEKNTDLDADLDGAVIAGQKFTHKITATTELIEKVSALWKMDDFGDALYVFGAGIAASITEGTQMKIEFLDTYKAKPPSADVQKNDIATLVSFVYKFSNALRRGGTLVQPLADGSRPHDLRYAWPAQDRSPGSCGAHGSNRPGASI